MSVNILSRHERVLKCREVRFERDKERDGESLQHLERHSQGKINVNNLFIVFEFDDTFTELCAISMQKNDDMDGVKFKVLRGFLQFTDVLGTGNQHNEFRVNGRVLDVEREIEMADWTHRRVEIFTGSS